MVYLSELQVDLIDVILILTQEFHLCVSKQLYSLVAPLELELVFILAIQAQEDPRQLAP